MVAWILMGDRLHRGHNIPHLHNLSPLSPSSKCDGPDRSRYFQGKSKLPPYSKNDTSSWHTQCHDCTWVWITEIVLVRIACIVSLPFATHCNLEHLSFFRTQHDHQSTQFCIWSTDKRRINSWCTLFIIGTSGYFDQIQGSCLFLAAVRCSQLDALLMLRPSWSYLIHSKLLGTALNPW